MQHIILDTPAVFWPYAHRDGGPSHHLRHGDGTAAVAARPLGRGAAYDGVEGTRLIQKYAALALFALTHYAFAIVLFVAAYGFGRRLLARVRFANACDEAAYSAGAGIGLFAQSVFLLGLAHLLYAPVIAAVLVAALVFGRRQVADAAIRCVDYMRNAARATRLWIGAAAAAAVIVGVLPLYPPHVWDSLSYHLPTARIYAEQGAVRPTEWFIFCVFTQMNEMLFSAAMLFSDAVAAHCVEFVLLLLILTTIAGAAQRLAIRRSWAVAAIAGIPIVVRLAATGYIDVGLMLFVTLFVLAFGQWFETRQPEWLVVSGAFAGVAASTKYTANFFVLCLGVVLLVHVVRKRAWGDLLRFTAPLAAIAVPWYAYIFIVTGNPVFPFLSNIFGTGCWTAGDVQYLRDEFARLGTPRTLPSLLQLPVNLAFRPEKFLLEAPLSPFVLGGIPIWIGAGIAVRRTRLLAILALLYTLFWFFAAQIPRYLFPAFPLFALFTATTLSLLADRLPAAVSRMLTPLVAIALLYPTIAFLRTLAPIGKPPVSQAERRVFSSRYTTYGCYEWLNDRFGANYTVYAWDVPFMRYFAEGTRIGDVIGRGRFRDVRHAPSPDFARRLREYGASFVLYAPTEGLRVPVPSDPWFRSHFVLSTTCGSGTLWRYSPEPVHQSFDSDIIDDGGFERIDGTRWHLEPSARPDFTGGQSNSGSAAVRVNPSSIEVWQGVPVAGARRYELVFHARSEGQTGTARIVTTWYDRRNDVIGNDVQDTPIDSTWRRYSFFTLSPSNAVNATIYPESIGAPAWYDDLSMRTMSYRPGVDTAQSSLFGVYRPQERRMYIRYEMSPGFAEKTVDLPVRGIPVAGDWDGDRALDAGVYDPATGSFHMITGGTDRTIAAERGGIPISGDWNGTGRSNAGLFYPADALFVLYDGDKPFARFRYGAPNDRPVAGDWDGDGRTTIGTYTSSTGAFHLRNENGSGPDDATIPWGSGREIPVAGDWNGTGTTSVGVFDPQSAVFRLRGNDGTPIVIPFGIANDYGFAATTPRPR